MASLHIPDETLARLRQHALATGRKPDDIAAEAVAAYLDDEAKLATLRAALDEGEQSGIADDYSLADTLARLGLPPTAS
jgi:predicted transcriptional regulator